jgi:hypothetical protein
VAAASESELVGVYAHRSEVPRDVWKKFFGSADREIDMLVYAGQFLAEDAGIQQLLASKADSGVRLRLLFGDPEGRYVAQRAMEEGVEGMVGPKIRGALVYYRPPPPRQSRDPVSRHNVVQLDLPRRRPAVMASRIDYRHRLRDHRPSVCYVSRRSHRTMLATLIVAV